MALAVWVNLGHGEESVWYDGRMEIARGIYLDSGAHVDPDS